MSEFKLAPSINKVVYNHLLPILKLTFKEEEISEVAPSLLNVIDISHKIKTDGPPLIHCRKRSKLLRDLIMQFKGVYFKTSGDEYKFSTVEDLTPLNHQLIKQTKECVDIELAWLEQEWDHKIQDEGWHLNCAQSQTILQQITLFYTSNTSFSFYYCYFLSHAFSLVPNLYHRNCSHLCQPGCHVPTTSDNLVLLQCAYLNAFTSVSTAAMCLLFTGLQCDCRQVAALSALISDNPHMLSCASPNRTHQASDYWVHFLNYKARLYYSVLSNNLVMPTTSTAGRKIKVVIYYVCLHKLFSVWSSLFLHATIHFHKELIPALVIFYVYSMQSSYFSIFFKLIYSKLIYLLFNNFIS